MFHHTDVPDAIDRTVKERQSKNVAGGAHIHDRVRVFEHRQDQIKRHELPSAAVLVHAHGGLRGAATRFDENAFRWKVPAGEVAHRAGENRFAIPTEEPLGKAPLVVLGPVLRPVDLFLLQLLR